MDWKEERAHWGVVVICPANKYKYSNTQIQARADRGEVVLCRGSSRRSRIKVWSKFIWFDIHHWYLFYFPHNHFMAGSEYKLPEQRFYLQENRCIHCSTPKVQDIQTWKLWQYQLVKAISTVLRKMLHKDGILADSCLPSHLLLTLTNKYEPDDETSRHV